MRILVTGVCGFVGSAVALDLLAHLEGLEMVGVDNLSRPGSDHNRARLKRAGVRVWHGDIRQASDLDALPAVDWVVDAAANPSVLAGVAGETSSRQLVEHNLFGTLQVLEYCKRHTAGLVMLSTSRVYALDALAAIAVQVKDDAFEPVGATQPPGMSEAGIAENFPVTPPLSLYGAAKLASETMALEYGAAFGFPIVINRCGVMAGAGQFGKPDQGILAFWIHSYRGRRPLRYIGFGGTGYQVRDCLHPRDLAALLVKQIAAPTTIGRVLNVSGGRANSVSLAQLTAWCRARFGAHEIAADTKARRYDAPWIVLDAAEACAQWDWRPVVSLSEMLDEIAEHAERHPEWLDLSADA